MTALTFETREALLRLEQSGNEDSAPIITLKLSLSSQPTIYISGGQLLQPSRWTMAIRARAPSDQADQHQAASLTYSVNDGVGECLVQVEQTATRFADLLTMFKGGHTSEITLVIEGLQQQDDYSSLWDTDLTPTLAVINIGFEFPLPQSEA
jgi:hypothetical protein